MVIYHWLTDYRRAWGRGAVFVCATTIAEARALAIAAFDSDYRRKEDWDFAEDGAPVDSDCAQKYQDAREQFERDITSEPTEHAVYFQNGGD